MKEKICMETNVRIAIQEGICEGFSEIDKSFAMEQPENAREIGSTA